MDGFASARALRSEEVVTCAQKVGVLPICNTIQKPKSALATVLNEIYSMLKSTKKDPAPYHTHPRLQLLESPENSVLRKANQIVVGFFHC